MQDAYQAETLITDTTDVHGVAAWMRVRPDRVQRWTNRRHRPLIPYSLEGGRKLFQTRKIESHIRRKCFCPVSGVSTPWSEEKFTAQITYLPGLRLFWTREFIIWSGLTKAQVDRRVRLGEFPHFQFGGIRLWDPALILEAREFRTREPQPTGITDVCHFSRAQRSKQKQEWNKPNEN